MAKINLKVDFKKIGNNALNIFKENSGTFISGGIMICLALLCKKFDIPYQVLTDPIGGGFTSRGDSKEQTRLLLIPNNSIEASMGAIYDGLNKDDWDSTKEAAAKQIMSILASRKNDLDESTKTYTIGLLRGISEKCTWDSTRSSINRMIANIGKGVF